MGKGDWGVKVLKFDGAIAPKVLKFDAPPARGLLWAPCIYRRRPLMIKPDNRALPEEKQADLAPQARLYGFPLQNAYYAI